MEGAEEGQGVSLLCTNMYVMIIKSNHSNASVRFISI